MEWEGDCVCLPHVEEEGPGVAATTFDVAAGEPLDWEAIDEALVEGEVHVLFGAGRWEERIDILRGDTGPHRLVLDGQGHASVAGIHTGFEDVPRSRITVRRFEVTGSRDKGIYFRAGDEVLIELNEVHDNGGSPSINLDYSNRSGHRSTSFRVLNNHIWDQTGECLYIGGSEGEDQPSHDYVEVRGNLIHDCRNLSTRNDGINIKDRIGRVWVAHNVVAYTDWGIEAASPGLYEHNVVMRTDRNGLQLSDAFAPGLDGLLFVDTVVLEPGEAGVRVDSERVATSDLVFRDLVLSDPREVGLRAGGEATISIDGLQLHGVDEVFQDWGGVSWQVEGQVRSSEPLDLQAPAGPDRLFFTGDEPWL